MEKPLRNDCPRCGTKSVAFEVKSVVQRDSGGVRRNDTFATCAYCGRGVLFMYTVFPGPVSPVVEVAPASSSKPPKHLSERVADLFRQGADNLPQNPDAAGMSFRKTLDIALKEKFPALKGKLVERIEQAAAQGQLTRDLADWAHQIRVDGNEATHEEEPFSKDDAQRLHDFTHLALIYLFSLPGMLEKAKASTEAPETEEKAGAARQAKVPIIEPLRGGLGGG